MYAPPYSPLARDSERSLPHYTPIIWQAAEEEVNPFDTYTYHDAPSDTSHDDDLVEPTMVLATPDVPARRTRTRFPLITSRTFPTYNYDPWSAIRRSQAFELPKYTASSLTPPEYDTIDTQARTFRLEAPFIYASKTSTLPQYQIARDDHETTLKLRKLKPCETRAYSVPAIHSARSPRIQYDDSETMYTMTSSSMHGHGDANLVGSIQVTTGRTLWGSTAAKVWHISDRRDSFTSQSRRDGDKTLLYTIKKGVWEDGEGTIVAREEKGSMLEITETWAKDKERRDLVVACWAMRRWCENGEGWDWDVKS